MSWKKEKEKKGWKELIYRTAIHSLTDVCFSKCVPIGNKISPGGLERSERECVQNCVDRFMDGTKTVLEKLKRGG